jgi:hypothetical protein
MMQNAPVRTIFGEITDFLATSPTPEEIIAYRLPDDLQNRAHQLLELRACPVQVIYRNIVGFSAKFVIKIWLDIYKIS